MLWDRIFRKQLPYKCPDIKNVLLVGPGESFACAFTVSLRVFVIEFLNSLGLSNDGEPVTMRKDGIPMWDE